MEKLTQRWKNVPAGIRKPVILVVGSLIVIGGIILLPLPGPGWVIIFAGFALLATEFEAAERVRAWLVNIFKTGANYLRNAWYKVRGKSIPTKHSPSKDTTRSKSNSKH